LNDGKVGRPFKITDRYVALIAVIRHIFSMPHRRIEGFTRALSRLIPRLPPVDYSWVRRRILRLDLNPCRSSSTYTRKNCMTRNVENLAEELVAKAYIYNMLITCKTKVRTGS
jgi:hypothetical protein